jgi:Ni/Co efflux regulator RcnB
MRYLLLGAAALFAAAVPASADAQRGDRTGFNAGAGDHARDMVVRIHRGIDRGRDDDRDGRHHRGRFDRGDTYFGYREYQGDSLWGPKSFNDWWHDRPDRAYPAWVARNGKCERMWWSGGDWRC